MEYASFCFSARIRGVLWTEIGEIGIVWRKMMSAKCARQGSFLGPIVLGLKFMLVGNSALGEFVEL